MPLKVPYFFRSAKREIRLNFPSIIAYCVRRGPSTDLPEAQLLHDREEGREGGWGLVGWVTIALGIMPRLLSG